MNRKLKILKIVPWPRWKFWSTNRWEITVQINGQRKKVGIFTCGSIVPNNFLDYVKYKALYGDQWWDLNQKKKEKKGAEEQSLEDQVQKLVGTEISL